MKAAGTKSVMLTTTKFSKYDQSDAVIKRKCELLGVSFKHAIFKALWDGDAVVGTRQHTPFEQF